MRYFIILVLLVVSPSVSATIYYVNSSGGSDSNSGISEATAWQSINKVNNMSGFIKPGDQILFKRGDTFYGQLKITSSGRAANPITVSAYGTGVKPVITGFTTITNWKNEGNGIYSSVVQCQSSPEMVTINGVQFAMGRWPNGTTWATVDSHSGDASITDSELNANGINWSGAELVQRKSTRNIIDRNRITTHTLQTLYYPGIGRWLPANGWGYFIQNDIRTLDVFGEWYFDGKSSVFYMYFGSEIPNTKIIQVATINELCTLFYEDNKPKDYIIIENISFIGSNHYAIKGWRNEYCIFQNCEIEFSGYSAIVGERSVSLQVLNMKIDHSNDCAIRLAAYCHHSLIADNMITNTGLFPGMGQSGWETGKSFHFIQSDSVVIENNIILNSGFSGISYGGKGSIVRNNIVNKFAIYKSDCGGIQHGEGPTSINLTVTNNIVLNGVESPGGMPAGQTSWVAGIYFDSNSNGGTTVRNNTVANVCYWGILISGSSNFDVSNNLVYNSDRCIMIQTLPGFGYPCENINMNGNVFFAKTSTQYPMIIQSLNNDFEKRGIFDNNYYVNPVNNEKPILLYIIYNPFYRTLAEWQTLYGMDKNSKISPVTLKDIANIEFYYNETNSNKVITLAQPMIDVKGTKYQRSVTLLPFSSIVLMVDPNPATPDVPVLASLKIENATSSLLEMTYNQTLANIVPDASSFSVLVNSVVRTVNNVAVSDTKVTLNLATPVIFGEIITVAYTKPSTNPLQTNVGGQATSFTAKSVTNNVSAATPTYASSVIENASPNRIELTYNLSLTNIVPPSSAFIVMVNSFSRTVNSVVVSGTKVLLTLASPVAYGDAITVAYTKPAANSIQTSTGGQAGSFTAQSVTNNCTAPPANLSPLVSLSSPTKSTSFISPATITIDAVASDPDGTIAKVEFYNGTVKLGERAVTPYSYVWKDVSDGTYSITAVATDNKNSKTVSSAVSVFVEKAAVAINQLPVISISSPIRNKKYKKNDKIVIEVVASDPDGVISKVELKSGNTIFAELTSPPYSYIYEALDTGTYLITAIATDNLGATSSSSNVELIIEPFYDENSETIILYPNPNDGRFSIDLLSPSPAVTNNVTIISLTGKTVYYGILTDEEYTRQFDISYAEPGAYILMVTNGYNIATTKKFIKN